MFINCPLIQFFFIKIFSLAIINIIIELLNNIILLIKILIMICINSLKFIFNYLARLILLHRNKKFCKFQTMQFSLFSLYAHLRIFETCQFKHRGIIEVTFINFIILFFHLHTLFFNNTSV